MSVMPSGGGRRPPSGNYIITPQVLVNGVPMPAANWSVDINSYSMSSTIDAEIITTPVRGFAPLPTSFAQLMQTVRPTPFEIRCGFARGRETSPVVLESGFIDERESEYDAAPQYKRLFGRGTASIFQEIQATDPIDRNQGGSTLIKQFFGQYGVPLTVTADSPQYAGSVADDENDPVYAATMRDRTVWDEMQAIALADGYRLTVHAGKGIYGPPVNDPVLNYEWRSKGSGSGLLTLRVRHAPRKSHNIKVILHSTSPSGKTRTYGSYGQASATDGETFHFTEIGLTNAQAKARAQAIAEDIGVREFFVEAMVAPDETLMRTIVQNGANFSVQLSGMIDPGEALLYYVRQVRLEFDPSRQGKGNDPGGGSLPLTAKLVMGNLNPIQQGAFLS